MQPRRRLSKLQIRRPSKIHNWSSVDYSKPILYAMNWIACSLDFGLRGPHGTRISRFKEVQVVDSRPKTLPRRALMLRVRELAPVCCSGLGATETPSCPRHAACRANTSTSLQICEDDFCTAEFIANHLPVVATFYNTNLSRHPPTNIRT